MTRFDRVKEILDLAVNGEAIAAHGTFWRNLNHAQFLVKKVFGKQLVLSGNAAGSNIILALRGLAPFGLDIGTPGAIHNRMPSGGRQPMPEDHIRFLEQWINDGCPEDSWPPVVLGPVPQALITDQQINDFYRTLDNWSAFQRTQEVDDAINEFFDITNVWFSVASGQATEADWKAAAGTPAAHGAVALLGGKQEETVHQFFGSPPNRENLAVAYERFGDDTLPNDPLRPNNRHHMDGPSMWFFWLAFADAAKVAGRDPAFWNALTRALLLGMLADGVFRHRYQVNGFTADDMGKVAMRAFSQTLPDADLVEESRRRFRESGLGA